MPIYLPAPEPDPRGPDGQGWNRLSLGAHYGRIRAQCALRPRAYFTLHETMRNTGLAGFGYHGYCVRDTPGNFPDCGTCPVFTAPPRELDVPTDRVLVRLERLTAGSWLATRTYEIPYVVTDPDEGWDSPREEWTWDELARLNGWQVGREHRDEHSAGFWLQRVSNTPPAPVP